MFLLDVNVLVYAHRLDMPRHQQALRWLEQLIASGEAYATSEGVLASFLRLVTNPRIFSLPSTLEEGLAFCAEVRSSPGFVPAEPGPRYWSIFEDLCKATGAIGDRIPDVALAALAIEHGCDVASYDSGFARFPGLRWRNLLLESGT